jgi:putative DNA primase/helicase
MDSGRYVSNPEYPNDKWDPVVRCWVPKSSVKTVHLPGVVSTPASEIEPEPVSWIWKEWLARGKLQLIAGAAGAGKTTLALACAAIISAGERWPDGTRAEVGNVLLWSSEDDAEDTLIPRLIRMGSNLKNVRLVRETTLDGKPRAFNPATDMPALEVHAKALGQVDLLVLDPVVAAIGGKDSYKNAETRIGLQPVADFARETNCAVLGISHFSKRTAGQDPIERVTGSIAFGALPRVVWAAAVCKEGDENSRILVRAKTNLGKPGGGFGYDIDAAPLVERPDIEATRIRWGEPLEGDPRELLASAEDEPKEDDSSKKAAAVRFLTDALAKGERPQLEIQEQAGQEGISERTLRRAAKGRVSKRREGFGGRWLWELTS